ncbi:hypothetical protein [Actinopolymorpha alba]|uniref:hypothetical protein n=1 Tax=Actinopolymorpha alba TaxID=533267 RepID=UPI0003809401|nr:hypothetical protein [Actinopolymorpha alba]
MRTMDDNNIRAALERSLDGEPAGNPPMTDDVTRGRKALRWRRARATAGAVCGVALVVGAAYAVPGVVGGGTQASFFGGGPATPTTGPSSPAATPTASPSATPRPTTPAPRPSVTVPDTPKPTVARGGSTGPGKVDTLPGPLPTASFRGVVVKHLGTPNYSANGVSYSGTSPDQHDEELSWGTWSDGDAKGTVVVALYRPGADLQWIDKGPDRRSCAVRPVKSFVDGFSWTSCRSETLADGSTLRVAEGRDPHAAARGVTLLRKDGWIVSIATSTGYFERGGEDLSTLEPTLAALPLTVETMRAVVTDPDMIAD